MRFISLTLWDPVHYDRLHFIKLVSDVLFFVFLFFKFFPVKLHFDVFEFSGNHMHWHILKVSLYFGNFFLSKTRGWGFVVHLEELYILNPIVWSPLDTFTLGVGLRIRQVERVVLKIRSAAKWLRWCLRRRELLAELMHRRLLMLNLLERSLLLNGLRGLIRAARSGITIGRENRIQRIPICFLAPLQEFLLFFCWEERINDWGTHRLGAWRLLSLGRECAWNHTVFFWIYIIIIV